MSKDQIIDLSKTAASNTDIGGNGTQGTNLVSGFDDALRYLGKILADDVTRHVTKTVGSYTAVKTDHNQFWRCTGAVTLNLTAAATLTDGWCLWVRANGGAVTINPNGTENIDGGSASLVIPDGASCRIVCTGSEFFAEFNTGVLAPGFPLVAQGRLSLESFVPVSVTDQLAKSIIYYTPYNGNSIALYSGAGWVIRSIGSQISLALTATSGKPYDVFVYDNAGTATLETLVWTDDTTRATALVRQDGVWCKTGALTRRYVGTFYASASNQCEDSRKKRYVWNMDNRVTRACANALETTDTWTYTLAALRQANANAANQLDFVRGLDDDMVDATVMALGTNTTVATFMYVGIGLDSTTSAVSSPDHIPGSQRVPVSGAYLQMIARYMGLPGVGRHVLTWLEGSNATGTTTWSGDLGGTSPNSSFQAGMLGTLRA